MLSTKRATVKPFDVVHDGRVKDDAWIAARRSVPALGASEVVALLGLSPFSNPLKLYVERVNPRSRPDRQSYVKRMGNAIEPLALSMLAEEISATVKRETRLLRSRRFPCLMASPDGWVSVDGKKIAGAEAKYTTWRAEEWEDGRHPMDAWCQSQVGAAVAGLPLWFMVGMLPGDGPHIRRAEFNEPYIEDVVVPRVEEFIRRVELKDPPPLESDLSLSSAEVTDLLRRAWIPQESVLQLEGDALAEFVQLDSAFQVAEAASKQKDELRNRIRLIMGDHTEVQLPDGSRWTNKVKSAPSWDIPDEVKAQYRVEGTTRELRRFAPKKGAK